MKLINFILLLLPFTGFSQYDKWIEADSIITGKIKITGNKVYTWKRPEPKPYKPQPDTLPVVGSTSLPSNYFNRWPNHYTSTEIAKGKVETPVNVMDSGLKVEVVETRDTVYECPYSAISLTYYVNTNGNKSLEPDHRNCVKKEVITTRRYKMYIINEYGQKEYLEMEITKKK